MLLSANSHTYYYYYYYYFFDPGTQFPRKEKITLCNIKKVQSIIIIIIIFFWPRYSIIIIIIIIFNTPGSKDPRG